MVQYKNIQNEVLPCDEIWAFVVIWATESEIGDVLVAIFTAKKYTVLQLGRSTSLLTGLTSAIPLSWTAELPE